jgi:hypothetical protein
MRFETPDDNILNISAKIYKILLELYPGGMPRKNLNQLFPFRSFNVPGLSVADALYMAPKFAFLEIGICKTSGLPCFWAKALTRRTKVVKITVHRISRSETVDRPSISSCDVT